MICECLNSANSISDPSHCGIFGVFVVGLHFSGNAWRSYSCWSAIIATFASVFYSTTIVVALDPLIESSKSLGGCEQWRVKRVERASANNSLRTMRLFVAIISPYCTHCSSIFPATQGFLREGPNGLCAPQTISQSIPGKISLANK